MRVWLTTIRDRFPATATTPVIFEVLSSLAEGADRLVVQEATRVLANAGRLDVQAVLPLPTAEYTQDFRSERSIEEFERLVEKASLAPPFPRAASREAAYERAGRYVVDHSDVLVALWDGREAAGRAGTAEIVQYAQRSGVPLTLIPAPRSRGAADRRDVHVATEVDPGLTGASEAYRRTVEFNDRSVTAPAMREQIDRENRRLLRPLEGSAEPHPYQAILDWALPRFVRSDMLALKYQRRHLVVSDGLYVCAALAVTAVAAQSQAGWGSRIALVEVGLMLALVALYAVGRLVHVHDRWLGYRSLAEAFRSALFIATAETPDRSSNRSARSGHDEPWHQRAFSEAWRERPTSVPDQSAEDLRELLVAGWIDPQIRYHRDTVVRLGRHRRLITTALLTLFGLTIVFGLMHAFEVGGESSSTNVFVFLAVALPAFGAALTGVRDQRQYRIHEQRSRRTAARLEQLKAQVQAQTRLAPTRRLAGRVQAAIETDKLDWWGVSEFQDVEFLM